MEFDLSKHFSPTEFSSAGFKNSAWIKSGGLNSLGRSKFELGLAPKKFGVWTGPY